MSRSSSTSSQWGRNPVEEEEEEEDPGFFSIMSDTFTSLHRSVEELLTAASDDLVDTIFPEDESDVTYVDMEDGSAGESIELMDMSNKRSGPTIADAEAAIDNIIQGNVDALYRRGRNLNRLDDTLERTAQSARVARETARAIREHAEQERGCCSIM